MQKPTSKRLTIAGLSLTLGYIVFVAWYWADQSSSLAELKPNEFGDFLAGVFAPLAFLWLVLGFLQQGMELRNSADALWLQGEELRNSVEQQRSLVEVTRDQLSLERSVLEAQQEEIARSSQPVLELRPAGSLSHGQGTMSFRFHLFNHGQSCTDVKISWSDQDRTWRMGALKAGDRHEISKEDLLESAGTTEMTVTYIDARSLRRERKFTVIKKRSDFEIIGNPDS
jgi:hypothetical protein